MLKHRDLATLASAVFMVLAAPRTALVQYDPTRASQAMPQTPADSQAYLLAPGSILEVHVGKSGLLAGLGHEHRIRAHAFQGTVVYFPNDVGRSHVTVTVLTDSLRVVPEADSADIPEITRTMREKTLKVATFPEIVFESRGVVVLEGTEATGPGSNTRRLRVTGNLTMVGVTRPVGVDLTVSLTADTLRAEGSFVVKQTDFGIKPYSKALGLVKVKNEVRFEFRAAAGRVP